MFNLVQFIKKQAGDLEQDHKKEKISEAAQGLSGTIKLPELDVKPAPASGKSAVHDATSTPSVGRNQSAPKPQRTQKITKIPRPFSKIAYKRNTGVVDADGLPYTNTDDVELLSKLGYSIDADHYLFLPMGESKEDLYSYVEKCAGVPSVPSQAIDKGEAFSSEYLKDMGYEVPEGYEVKGDLVCPIEKKAAFEKIAIGNRSINRLAKIIQKADVEGKEILFDRLKKFVSNQSKKNLDLFNKRIQTSNQLTKENLRSLLYPEQKIESLYSNKNIGAHKLLGMYDVDQNFTKLNFTPQLSSIDEIERVLFLKKNPEARASIYEALVSSDNTKLNKIKPEKIFKPADISEEGAIDISLLPKDKSKVYKGTENVDGLENMHNLVIEKRPANRGGNVKLKQNLLDRIKGLFRVKQKSPEGARYFVTGDPEIAASYSSPAKYWKPVDTEAYRKGLIEQKSKLQWFEPIEKKAELVKTAEDNYTLYRGTKEPLASADSNYYDLLRKALKNQLSEKKDQKLLQELARRQRGFFTTDKTIAENYAGTDGHLYSLDLKDSDLSKIYGDYNNLGKANQALVLNVPHELANKARLVDKTAAADPSQTILITGHSGSGKSTLGKLLAEKLNLPLHRVDAQQSWDDLRANLEAAPDYERKALTPGTIENKKYIRDIRKIVRKSLGDIDGPAILEGTQVTTLPDKQLKKYMANILVGGDINQSIAQRLERMSAKAAKKGINFSPEQIEKKKLESKLVAESWSPGMDKFNKLPGVLKYNHTEHKPEALIDKLKALMNKKAEATHELKSSNIKAVGYDKENKKLEVAFHSGGNYTYNDVPKSLFNRIKRVKSPGKFFHKHIKKDNPYSYERMDKEADYQWYMSKPLRQRLTNGRGWPFSYLTGEAEELVDAIKNRDWENFKEEIGDTTFGAQMLLSQATGLNHPVYADLSKAWAREKVWKDMFKEKGSTYHPKHMQGGSNYAKASKIIKAFASAGIKVDQREAERLANKYTGGKMEKEANVMVPRPGTVTNLEAYKEPVPSKMDMLGTILLGDAYIPTPRNQESMLEAKQRNRRNVDMIYLDTDTAKAIGEKISPFIGGNPVKAKLDLERMQQHPNIMSQFKQANSILDKMQAKIYKQIEYAS